jgi:hypothetical protein
MTDDECESEVTMVRYTFEYMVSEANEWTRSRKWFHDHDTAAKEGEAFLRMCMPNGKSTLIRVVRIAE